MGEDLFREDFDVPFTDFLDMLYERSREANGRRRPVGGPDPPETDTRLLLMHIDQGIIQFGREEAFAVLLNPMDKMRFEMTNAELSGQYLWEAIEEASEHETITFEGKIVQAAQFVREGTYVVIGEEDYRELTRPENIQ